MTIFVNPFYHFRKTINSVFGIPDTPYLRAEIVDRTPIPLPMYQLTEVTHFNTRPRSADEMDRLRWTFNGSVEQSCSSQLKIETLFQTPFKDPSTVMWVERVRSYSATIIPKDSVAGLHVHKSNKTYFREFIAKNEEDQTALLHQFLAFNDASRDTFRTKLFDLSAQFAAQVTQTSVEAIHNLAIFAQVNSGLALLIAEEFIIEIMGIVWYLSCYKMLGEGANFVVFLKQTLFHLNYLTATYRSAIFICTGTAVTVFLGFPRSPGFVGRFPSLFSAGYKLFSSAGATAATAATGATAATTATTATAATAVVTAGTKAVTNWSFFTINSGPFSVFPGKPPIEK